MDTSPVIAELEAVATEHPEIRPFVQRLRNTAPGFEVRAPLVAAAATAAGRCPGTC